MDRLVVRPSGQLHGVVRVEGAKNSALKLMAACLLSEGTSTLGEVPDIADVAIMSEVLGAIGATVERSGDALSITTPALLTPIAPYELVEKMRASFVVLGPLLARVGHAKVSLPGGDDFGSRPIDIHLRALSELGVTFTNEHGYIEGQADRLVGTRIAFDFPSHTATDNVMMAAVLAKGTTVIENAAREPEVQDLANFLGSMGAQIEGAGTSRIEIEGVEQLHCATHVCIPDPIEAATYLIAVAMTGGEVRVDRAIATDMDMLLEKLIAMGAAIVPQSGGILISSPGSLRAIDVATLPYPGFATDYKPPLVAALAVAQGVSIASENLFAGRFRYVDELRRMGADIRTEGHHAIIRGVPSLSGAQVRAPDIRAGAALVLAGLVAEGETVIDGVEHIDRGYFDIVGKLSRLGADISREFVENRSR